MISDAHCSKTLRDCVTVGSVAVSHEVVRSFIPWEGIGDLAGNLFRRRIGGHRKRYQSPALVPKNDQDEQQLEAHRRHDQEVHRADA